MIDSVTEPLSAASVLERRRQLLFQVAVGASLYYLLVILWGSWVRIAGAGAGCGDPWPLCNGEIVPTSGGGKTFIEYTHRVSSGLAGPVGLWLVILAFRASQGWDRVRVAAVAQLAFLGIEGLIGRSLVKNGLVVDDDSVARAVVMGLHLVNTYALLAASVLTAFWARPPKTTASRPVGLLLWLSTAALLLISATGAITALGDTLFPPEHRPAAGFWGRVESAFDPGVHFILRLMVLHPFISILGAILVAVAARLGAPNPFRRWLVVLLVFQLGFGALNVWLMAPGWAQLVHLFLAESVWIAFVLAVAARRDGVAEPA